MLKLIEFLLFHSKYRSLYKTEIFAVSIKKRINNYSLCNEFSNLSELPSNLDPETFLCVNAISSLNSSQIKVIHQIKFLPKLLPIFKENINLHQRKHSISQYLFSGENVFKALRRLGGVKKPVSTADRWKKKKANIQEAPLTDEQKKKKEQLLKLTELADSLLTNGEFQIYEKTYEKLNFEIKEKESQFEDAPMDEEGDDEDDALEAAFKGTTTDDVKEQREVKTPVVSSGNAVDASSEVHWYYKVKDDEACELQGPFSSSQMLKWQEEGKFEQGVFCRKADNDGGQFYNSKRVDFELYT